MTKPQTVKVEASKHRYSMTTDTGWRWSYWTLTQGGMRRAVCSHLHACGMPVTETSAGEIIALSRRHGWVSVGGPWADEPA